MIPLPDRDPQVRRGLLIVARTDLLQARQDYPHLADDRIDQVLTFMSDTIDALPAPPRIGVLQTLKPA
ncbi:hypothetical protein ALI144C_16610 [Actinosynnema sp. ALI-1.44]|uniref:hypothetical protein n=1 Tax=Actinosynnema sp. ALI-1.44 TaxID=1933779 RepID=UPI00097C02A6|nr:hypothetical protein [Actinosynnema sp. ALI-1.44]ONI83127.1 hypothetical protein ALI144C_16610 [Actinosynnema sp. ALI-1.44]